MDLEERLRRYFADQGVTGPVCSADRVVALLRMGEREAAESVLGRPILVCPPYLPPWPPRPVARVPAGRKVASVARNPCQPTTEAWQRYRRVGLGMTEDQLMGRGVTRRDLTRWTRLGYLEWRE